MRGIRQKVPATLTTLLTLVLLLATVGSVRPQGTIDQSALDRAHNFLKTANQGQFILGYVHFGADYKRHAYQETLNVRNRAGHFALVYRYDWADDGVTKLAFLCNEKGNVYEVQVTSTNAVIQQPYAIANASINILGNLILQAFRNNMTAAQIQQAQQFIDNQNARGLLEMGLQLRQAFGQ